MFCRFEIMANTTQEETPSEEAIQMSASNQTFSDEQSPIHDEKEEGKWSEPDLPSTSPHDLYTAKQAAAARWL